MTFELNTFLGGSVTTLIIILVGLFALAGMIFGKAKQQLKFLLTKLYTRTSLMLIALVDVVAAFDPSQTVVGLGLAPLAAILVFGSEWGLHDRFKMDKIGVAVIVSFIAAVIVAIPLPVAGLFVAWFGVVGDKKKK